MATRPGEWRLIAALEERRLVTLLPDDRFVCVAAAFDAWAEGRKELRMEYFYREMRRKTGLLMEGDTPRGGQVELRPRQPQAGADDLLRRARCGSTPDAITEEVLDLVEARFADNFGALRPLPFAVTRAQALQALEHFATAPAARFRPYQDAMLAGDRFLIIRCCRRI